MRHAAKGTNWLLVLMLLAGMMVMPALAEGGTMQETAHEPFNEAFYNPIQVDFMLGDPWLTYHDGMYYYTHSRGQRVAVTATPTISGLMAQREAVHNVYLGIENNQTQLWAPELHFYQGHWYAFYAADYDNDNAQHRMYVTRSDTDDPFGEWTYQGKLDLPEDQWAIDGTFFENADGRIFHIWSGWKSESQGLSLWKQYLYIAELEPGDPSKVISEERVMISKPELYWEMSVLPQNEGPAMLISPGGTVYCVYAANYSGSDDYALGALRLVGDDPMDPEAWEKLQEPILAPSPEDHVYGPGHASFTKSPDGTEDWVIYHAAKASGSGWNRSVRAQKVEWVDDTPVIAGPLPLDMLIPLPSGEVVDRIKIELEDAELSDGATIVDGPKDGKAVHFAKQAETATVTVRAETAGDYALFVRHGNAGQEESAFWVSVGGAKEQRVPASITAAPDQYVMATTIVTLEEGLNTLSFSAGPDVDIDLVIYDRTPIDAEP